MAFKQEEMEKSEATAKTLDVGQCHFRVGPLLEPFHLSACIVLFPSQEWCIFFATLLLN